MITPAYGITATEKSLPALALDFTTASLDAKVTFTRANATATRVNSNGYIETVAADTPRFDYDPITLVIRGLLIEESRVNRFLRSQEFSNTGAWATGSRVTVVADQTTGPDGLTTADSMTEVAVTGTHRLEQNLGSLTQTATYTISVYYKINSGAPYGLLFSSDASGNHGFRGWFDLTNGVVGSTQVVGGGSVSDLTIQNAGNGWYRCTLTGSYGASGTPGVYAYVGMADADLSLSYAGNTGRSVYIWGAQFEAGTFATSYIPTTSAVATRNADVAVVTGSNFSNFWYATEGSAIIKTLPRMVSGTRPTAQFDDNTANELVALRGVATDPQLYVVDGGVDQTTLDAGTIVVNTAYTLGGSWKASDFAVTLDGAATVTQTSGSLPTVTQLRLGCDGTNYLNGWLQNFRYWRLRLTNEQLQTFSK